MSGLRRIKHPLPAHTIPDDVVLFREDYRALLRVLRAADKVCSIQDPLEWNESYAALDRAVAAFRKVKK